WLLDVASYEGEVPVLLPDVEAVADHEVRGDGESGVAKVEVRLLQSLTDEQCADLDAVGVTGQEVLAEIGEGQTAVDDVLDDDHVASRQVDVEVLHDSNHTARPG